jgi:hypothetical protein
VNKLQPLLLEVTGALSECAKEAHFDFGHDTAVVAVQHLLWQTVDLFQALVELGVNPENIFATGKVYSTSPIVKDILRDMGVTVVESTMPAPGEYEQSFTKDVDRFWAVTAKCLAQRNIKRLLVLDDGGRCITQIPRDLLNRYQVCGVEQTSFGMFVFEENPPAFAVMSWARAAVKLQIGGGLFSHCLLDKVQSEFLGGKALEGQEVGIVGLGSIGSAMASLAAQQHNRVVFYDPDPNLVVPNYLNGSVRRASCLEELMTSSDFIFGCSGRNPFQHQWPVKYRPGIKLFSGSGGDHEFGPIIRTLKQSRDFEVAPLTWDISSDHGPSGPMLIAYLGYPYNFVSRDIEAVPTHIVQLETAGLLAGLIQARQHLSLCQESREKNAGIHRISLEAQHFVYETWLGTMKSRGVDLSETYGWDPALLTAAENLSWFRKRSEPYRASGNTELAMARILAPRSTLRLTGERKLEPDFCSS